MLSQRHVTRPQHRCETAAALHHRGLAQQSPRRWTCECMQCTGWMVERSGVEPPWGHSLVIRGGNERQKNTLSDRKDKCTPPSPLSAAAQHTARLRYGLTRALRTHKPMLICGGLNTAFGGWEEGHGVQPWHTGTHAPHTFAHKRHFTKRHNVDDWHVLGCSMADDG